MNIESAYSAFLRQAYPQILSACLGDEALETLKTLEQQDYLTLRINEVFAQAYCAERQKMIEEQAITIQKMEQQLGKSANKSGLKDVSKDIEMMAEALNEAQNTNKQLLRQMEQIKQEEQLSTKKVESLLKKENEQVKDQIIKLRVQLLQKQQFYTLQHVQWQKQLEEVKDRLTSQKQRLQSKAQNLKESLQRQQRETQKAQMQLFQALQRRAKEEKEVRDMQSKAASHHVSTEKLHNQVNTLRQENSLLNQQVTRLQQENSFLTDRHEYTSKENKNLKKHIETVTQQKETLRERLSQETAASSKGEAEHSTEALERLGQATRKIIESQKHINSLKSQLTTRQTSSNQTILQQDKEIFNLREQLKKVNLSHQRDLRMVRQEQKKLVSRQSQDLSDSFQRQKEEIVRKYESQLSEKTRKISNHEESLSQLRRQLSDTQRNMRQEVTVFEEEKALLIAQKQEEKRKLRELKGQLGSTKTSEELLLKEYKAKEEQRRNQISKLQQSKGEAQRQIRQLKKSISLTAEGKVMMEVKMQELQETNRKSGEKLESVYGEINSLKQTLRMKDKELRRREECEEELRQETEQLERRALMAEKNQKRLLQKIEGLQKELTNKREMLLVAQESSKQEIVSVLEQTQNSTASTRRQLEQYFLQLHQQQQSRHNSQEERQSERARWQQIVELKNKQAESQQKAKKLKSKWNEEAKEKEVMHQRLNQMEADLDRAKSELNIALERLRQEKVKNIGMAKSFKQKLGQYYEHFGHFKRELYISLKYELSKIKDELKRVAEYATQQSISFKDTALQLVQRVTHEAQLMATNHSLALEKVKHDYEYGVVLRLQEEKREVGLRWEMKAKELNMQFMGIVAQKDNSLQKSEEREATLQRKVDQLHANSEQMQKSSRDAIKKQEELKDVISKMNARVSQAERAAATATNQLQYHKRENVQLKRELTQLQSSFKEKIQDCRQKYTAENQRIFDKYQQQFSKFIVSNKHSLSMATLGQSLQMQVPTKDQHLDKLEQQIEEQKTKLRLLEKGGGSRAKLDKTVKVPEVMKSAQKQKKGRL